jgi:hypothetical protein
MAAFCIFASAKSEYLCKDKEEAGQENIHYTLNVERERKSSITYPLAMLLPFESRLVSFASKHTPRYRSREG